MAMVEKGKHIIISLRKPASTKTAPAVGIPAGMAYVPGEPLLDAEEVEAGLGSGSDPTPLLLACIVKTDCMQPLYITVSKLFINVIKFELPALCNDARLNNLYGILCGV